MHALSTTFSKHKIHAIRPTGKLNKSSRSAIPIMKSSVRARDALVGGWRQRATYYYDASWHTGKTFRQLIKSLDVSHSTSDLALGICSNTEFLIEQTDFFLHSLKPFVYGTKESKEKYFSLLKMHLSALDKSELEKFSHHLHRLNYNCHITESTIDDHMYLEYEFSNGPPNKKKYSLLTTSEFFQLLESLHESNESDDWASTNLPDITPAQAHTLRNQLSVCASDWIDSDKSLDSVLRIARQLEWVVCGEISLENIDVYSDEPGPSKVIQLNNKLLIDFMSMYELRHKNNESLFAVVLCDLLEIFLAKKIINPLIKVGDLSTIQRRRVWRTIEKITALAPDSLHLTPFRNHIKTLLSSSTCFGKVHIIPASGVALGHAWITPALSVMPDKQKIGIAAGTCYLRSGARLNAGISTINEWPIHWLTKAESEDLYPMRRAFHLPVPVAVSQLESAAQQLIDEWKRADQPYRFVSVGPESPATGCRISVWQAVEKGMDADTKLLFASFNRGLPLPESTIELWERLHGFMQWLKLLANDCRPETL